MLHNILVPLDGSALAERAMSVAMALASAVQGHVTLLRIPTLHPVSVDDYSGGYKWLYPDQAEDKTRAEAEQYLDNVARHWSANDVTIHKEVIAGDPAAVIVDTATQKGIELICMTTHGYSGLTRWMLGSVAERVLRAAPCPVMVMRDKQPLDHILITLDGSTLAECAVEPGIEIARRLGARVTLLQVATMVPIASDVVYQLEMTDRGISEYLASSTIDHAQLYLEAVADRLDDAGVPIDIAVVEGLAAQGIVDYAAQHGVDLIVMATHGRTGLRRWAYGSVTEKVLRSGKCSLVVVRPSEARFTE